MVRGTLAQTNSTGWGQAGLMRKLVEATVATNRTYCGHIWPGLQNGRANSCTRAV